MLLRESGRIAGFEIDPSRLDDSRPDASPVPRAPELAAFADAAGAEDSQALDAARQRLVESMGGEAMVEASAVIAAFHSLDRIADATGVRMDFGLDLATAGLREKMGLDRFPSSANSPMGRVRRRFARAIEPVLRVLWRQVLGSGP